MLPINQRHDRVIKIRLTDEDYEALERLAKFLDVPMATLARKLYRQGLRRVITDSSLREFQDEKRPS